MSAAPREASAAEAPAASDPRPLQSIPWFPAPKPVAPKGIAATLGELAVGGAVGALLFMSGRRTFALVVWGTSALLGAVSLASPRARAALGRAFSALGRGVGQVLGTALLTLAYALVVTPLRVLRRIEGADALHLRDVNRQSFWLLCDGDARKVRHLAAMFVTETPARRGGSLAQGLALVLVLLGVAELVLRSQGFGAEAVLYVSDPVVGYYTAPHQKLGRYGGRVETNSYGMRAPEYPADKPAGVFRVLLLGDSTLYGGSYLDQEELYSRLLEKRLNALAGAPGKVQVLAMGVNGWGPFHERGFVGKFGTFGADLAVVCGPTDDLNRDHYGLMSVPFFSVDNPPALALEEVVMHLTWQYRRNRTAFSVQWQSEQALAGAREVGRLFFDLQQKGAEVLFELLPSRDAGLRGTPLPQELERFGLIKDAADAHQVTVHFPNKLFAGKGRDDELYHDRTHLAKKGHAVYAGYLERAVLVTTKRFREWLSRETGKPPPP